MNYRDFYKSNNSAWKKYLHLLPEGVKPEEFKKGVEDEFKDHPQLGMGGAAETAAQHLKKRKDWYSAADKAGLEEKELIKGVNLDDNCCEDGLPRRADGALDIEHDGRPIRLSKIVQIGGEFKSGKSATGEMSGYTAIGGETEGHSDSVDTGGVPVKQDGDKESITSGGKSVNSSIAASTVGGPITPGEGQKQGGPNTKGCISGTPKIEGGGDNGEVSLSLQEAKSKLRGMVKDALKEITFDTKRGKWVKLNEGHKAGCECGFCKNKGTFGKKKKDDDKDDDKKDDKKGKKNKKKEVDENTVNMKMGPSYKQENPQYRTVEQDPARSVQYEPNITEMLDDEQEECMQERYESLVNAQRNLSESELQELRDLGSKLSLSENDSVMKMGPSYRVVAPRQCRSVEDDIARRNQDTPTSTNEAGGAAVQHSSGRSGEDNYPTHSKNRHKGDIDEAKKKVMRGSRPPEPTDDTRDWEPATSGDGGWIGNPLASSDPPTSSGVKRKVHGLSDQPEDIWEISDKQITIIHDLVKEIKKKYPHLDAEGLERVTSQIFKKQTGWSLDPESLKNAINQVF